MSSSRRDPAERAVAVVGMGAVLPDALSVQAFWNNVLAGRDCISDVPEERWSSADYYDPDPKAPEKTYSKIGGWIRGFTFEPTKYRIPPTVAASMDVGQSWVVAATAEAMKDAGHPERPLDLESTGVIVGNAMGGERHYITSLRLFAPEYRHALEDTAAFKGLPEKTRRALMDELMQQVFKRLPETTEDTMPGELSNIMAGRAAAVFNLRGPNFTADAACASSFAAMQAAIDGLVDHHYDAVFAGGMDRNMGPHTFIKFSKIGALSPDGSRPYAKGANGFVMGEGGAIFLLKRLEDAEKAGDKIYAVVRAIGSSSDGKGKGITAPNPAGQMLAVRRAWERAGLLPSTMTLVEGHGTSTQAGDVSEVKSLATVLGSAGIPNASIALGSIKSQIGHLKAGAGAAGVLKAILAIHNKTIPPSINFTEPNPEIELEKTPFFVPTKPMPWAPPAGTPRRAGVSAFGFGGTNFHVVLEEHVPGSLTTRRASVQVPSTVGSGREGNGVMARSSGEPAPAPLGNLLVLGAPDAASLATKLAAEVAGAKQGRVPERTSPSPETLSARERLVIGFDTASDLAKQGDATLAAFRKGETRTWRLLQAKGVHRGSGGPAKVAFLYPGQGSQYVNMLATLRRIEPVVAETFVEADRIMKPILGRRLTEYLFVDSKDPDVIAKAEDELRATVITQPAMLACDVALTRLLAKYGIMPDLVMGHSLGEWAAIVAAGMVPFADALVAVSSRAKGMAAVAPPDPGKMASVIGPYEQIATLLGQMKGYVVAANLNARNQTVIAGETEAVVRAVEQFKQAGLTSQLLPVSHAFHSKIVAAAAGPLRNVLESIAMRAPEIPVVANVTGELYPSEMGAIHDLLSVQLASPVQWVKSLETAYREGARVFVEVGPKRVLRGLTEDVLGDRDGVVCLSTNHPKRGDIPSFHDALCGLYAAGLPRPGRVVAAQSSLHAAPPPPPPSPAPPGGMAPPAGPPRGSPPDYVGLGKVFAKFLEEGLAIYRGQTPAAPSAVATGLPNYAAATNTAACGSVVISGAGLGLPGKTSRVFDDANVDRLLAGENFFDSIPEETRQRIVQKNIVRLVKREVGEPSLDAISKTSEVIKLAARRGAFDLASEFGIDQARVDAFDVTTALAIGAGIEALRDARIPLVRNYRRTTTGGRLPDRWLLPRSLADETGVIFCSAFPALDSMVDEMQRYHQDRFRRAMIVELEQIAKDNPRAQKRIVELKAELERETYAFDRRFLFRTLAMGHAQFGETIGARGPNVLLNSACASTTQAIGMASEWIRIGKCRRVVVIAADDPTSDRLLEWVGAGFLATGAATTEQRVELAALPFDKRRHGMLLGMGAAAVVIETQDALDERGIRGLAEILGVDTANSAFHGTRLDVEHIGEIMERMIVRVERTYGLSRGEIAKQAVFISHETYTPARGGSAAAEINALKRVFGASADKVVIANTKGQTGHPMGVGIEDAAAVKMLEKQIVPPVPNFREPDPELGTLNLSKGGRYDIRYALRFAAGFGSQLSMTLARRIPGCDQRVADASVNARWLTAVSGYPEPVVEVQNRTLRVRDDGAPAVEPIASSWAHWTVPVAKVLPLPAEEASGGAPMPALVQAVPAVVQAEPPAKAAPAPVQAAAAPAANDPVAESVLTLVGEKTGYPRDMLDLDLDLEADLGIDTVKQAEVFSLVRDTFGIARQEGVKLRDYPTLKHVIGFVREHRPDLAPAPVAEASAAALAPPPLASAPPVGGDEVADKVLELVSEKTGYPRDMLDLDLDLEADLGIDTVKQAEVFSLVRDTFNIARQEGVKLRDYPTLKHVIGFVRQHRPDLAEPAAAAPAPVAARAAAAPAPVAAPAAARAPVAARATSDDGIAEKVLAIVSEKTGYPPDMLELDLDLEADLGIDTVKQAEVFTLVRDTFGIARQEGVKLRDYPTLKHVIGFVHEHKPGAAVAAEAADGRAASTQPLVGAKEQAEGDLLRIPVPALRPPMEVCKATGVKIASGHRIIVVADKGGAAAALGKLLAKRGADVILVDDPPAPAEMQARVTEWVKAGTVSGVYFLTPLDPTPALADIEPAEWQKLNERQVKLLCAITRPMYDALGSAGTFLITATRMGGVHGYEPAGAISPVGGACTGFTKTISRERTAAVVKAVDFEAQATADEIAKALIAETEGDPDVYEVGRKDGSRFTISAIVEPAALAVRVQPMKLDNGTVFVVTGGAGAITSAIVQDLATASKGTFHLLDLLPAPDDATRSQIARMANDKEGLKRDIFEAIKAESGRATPALVEKRLFELERSQAILDTVAGVEAAGGRAVYHSVDVTSTDGVARAIDATLKASNRIDVILHTAGLERSRTFDTKPQEEFDRVYGVKVDGLYNLLRATKKTKVAAIVCFSSVAGRFGNPGQTDYSAANDLMCKVASNWRATNKGSLAVVFDWSAWGKIGMATRGSVPEMMRRAGIEMLDPDEATPLTRTALTTGLSSEVVVGRKLGALLEARDADGGIDKEAVMRLHKGLPLESVDLDVHSGLTVSISLDPKAEPFLTDHQIDGTPVLPGVMGLESFAETAALIAPGYHIRSIEDVHFLAPLKYYRHEPRSAVVRALLLRAPDGSIRVACSLSASQIIAGKTAQEKTHFLATVVLEHGADRPAKKHDGAPPNGGKTKKTAGKGKALAHGADKGSIDRDGIYRVYFHGPAYQVLSKVALSADGSVQGTMSANLPTDLSKADRTWIHAPRLVELCFQTAGVYEIGLTGQMGLPAAIGKVVVWETPPASRAIVAEVRPRRTEAGLVFDAAVKDESGRVYVELSGYTTSAIPGSLPDGDLAPFKPVGQVVG